MYTLSLLQNLSFCHESLLLYKAKKTTKIFIYWQNFMKSSYSNKQNTHTKANLQEFTHKYQHN